jgi:hypothetical protein
LNFFRSKKKAVYKKQTALSAMNNLTDFFAFPHHFMILLAGSSLGGLSFPV